MSRPSRADAVVTSEPETTTPAAPGPGAPVTAGEPLRYGRLELTGRAICAPICGASKAPYRMLARRFGASLAYTEMIKATPLARRDRKTFWLAERHPEETPSAIQICGANPVEMADATRIAIDELGFTTLDINMGCPVRKVVREGAGAAMLKDPSSVARVVDAVVGAAGDAPVTVKIRTGFDGSGISAVPVAKAAEGAGAAAIAIHGRHRSQHHSGDVDFDAIADVVASVRIPVIGNGSVNSPESAVRMIESTGCAAVMIGRGAFGTPWLFRDVQRAIQGLPAVPPPPMEEQLECALWHHERTMMLFGEEVGSRVFRKFAAWYFRNAPYGNQFRGAVYRATKADEVARLLREWFEHREKLMTRATALGESELAAFIGGATAEGAQERGGARLFVLNDDDGCAPRPARGTIVNSGS